MRFLSPCDAVQCPKVILSRCKVCPGVSVISEGSPHLKAQSTLFRKLNEELGNWDFPFGVERSLPADKRN